MKKFMAITVAGLLVFVLSGCTKNKQDAVDMDNLSKEDPAQKEDSGVGSVISGFKDAISSGKKMKCTYTVQQNGDEFKSEAFVEGEKYKSTSTLNGKGMYAVFDGKATYTWSDDSKQGMKMDTACLEEMQSQVEDHQGEAVEEEMHYDGDAFGGALDVKCERVSSIDFSVPTDVEFVDQCELMKNQQKQLEELQQNLPQGFELPDGVDIPSAQ